MVAIFIGMYSFPLTVYLFAKWFGKSCPVLDAFCHPNHHLISVEK
jgi:hypothetical protein